MFTKIDVKDIPGRVCGFNNQVQNDVLEFWKSGFEAAEVNIDKYKNAYSAHFAYKQAAKRLNVAVKPMTRSDRLFLIREEK